MPGRRGRGEGSIYRRSRDGRWVGSVVLAETGKRKSVTGATRQEVQRKLSALVRDIEQGLSPGDGRQTVAQYLTSWLETIKPTMEESTWVTHGSYARMHFIPALGRMQLMQLTPQRIQAFYARLLAGGLSSTTVNHMHGSLHKALDAAVRLGLVARNVTELVDVPRMASHEIHPLTKEQARQLLYVARGERLEALFTLALATGMRQGEILALHWRDVDLDARALSVRWSLRYHQGVFTVKEPKTRRSRRRIALAEQTVEALRAHRTRQLGERLKAGSGWQGAAWDDLVFCTEIGSPLTSNGQVRSTLRRIIRHASPAAPLPAIRFHDLRHTCATLALASNVNPKVVSEMLGHSTVAITLDIYSHVLPDMQEDAAAAVAAMLYG
ncbi:MAG TPA: site-specific integrase [Ktedonobacterales bacterium]|nr:site-specific integrase [Ktedonobacterales bacterium]